MPPMLFAALFLGFGVFLHAINTPGIRFGSASTFGMLTFIAVLGTAVYMGGPQMIAWSTP